MSTHCYVGTIDPAHPHVVHARFVLFDGHPRVVVPTLAAIWAGHARRDTQTLIAAILACDWEYLDPATTAAATSGFAGQHPVPGAGMTLATTGVDAAIDAPEPVTVFPLSQAGHLDAGWIYLIDPATATVTVHTDDGEPVSRYPLAGCVTSPPAAATGPIGDLRTAGAERRCGPAPAVGAPQ